VRRIRRVVTGPSGVLRSGISAGGMGRVSIRGS
jgi:hypothetical protein